MTTHETGRKVSIWKQFPGAFWSANVMEIFERMGWYGFYAVSSLYLMGSVEDGGLGFTSEERGVIQGLVTFLLYLFPAVFGALADRYGYRTMFIASTVVMIPGYLLLGIPTSFWGFFLVYLLVAVGHGMFKPVVISTIARTTTEKTGSMGFGIFYMMVNVGGWLGPLIASVVRGWSWAYVFYSSALWIGLVTLTAALFYREPPRDDEEDGSSKSLVEVLAGMVAVIGNMRFFVLIVGVMILLVLGSKWLAMLTVFGLVFCWFLVNFLADVVFRATGRSDESHWALQPMRMGETRYLIFLLLMTGFWVSFNQVFITLPLYIKDYVNTQDLIHALGPIAGWVTGAFESIGMDTSTWSKAVLEKGQIKPEQLINLNAFGIICLQLVVSYLSRKLSPLSTIMSGVSVTVVSFLIYLLGTGGWVIVSGILIFSVGEMLASPKSKEYAGRIAPPGKVGMYMGYFYWCVALGNLFGGLLSGVMYGHFGPDGWDRPSIMWIFFALLAASSVVLLKIYDTWIRANS